MNKNIPIGKGASSGALFPAIRRLADRLILLLLLGGICLFVLYPMLCILWRSLQGEGGITAEMYGVVWEQYRKSLYNSVFTASCTAILCTIFSTATALLISTGQGWRRTLGMGLLLITMVSPPFVSALAYIQLYGRRGWITYRLLGLSWNPYNCWGVIWMQSLSFVPVNALFLIGMLSRMDRDSLMSARDLGAAPKDILRDVVLPLLKPGILVCALLSFVRSIADFGTPVTIGGRFTTIASDIYIQLTGYSNLEKASAMNMFLLVPSVAAFFLYRWLMEKTGPVSSERAQQQHLQLTLRRCGVTGWLTLVTGGLFFGMIGLQYMCIFATGFIKRTKGKFTFTVQYLEELLKFNSGTVVRSVIYALFVALVGTLFAMLFAYYIYRRKIRLNTFFDCLATLPYMLPGTCFGIGYILAFNHAPLKLTGTAVIVLANMLFKQLPTTTKICAATLSQIPEAQEWAVRDLGGDQLNVMKDVIFPGLRSAFLSCFAYNFSSSMTTAGAVLFLIDPGHQLAVFKLFDAVYSGEYALASLMATFIIVIVLLVEGSAYMVMGRKERSHVS